MPYVVAWMLYVAPAPPLVPPSARLSQVCVRIEVEQLQYRERLKITWEREGKASQVEAPSTAPGDGKRPSSSPLTEPAKKART